MSKNIKTIKAESPKTPGGISISLLTPCRRVGLSRSWRKKGPSPFISPLSNSPNNSNDQQSDQAEKNPRKRKKDLTKEDGQEVENAEETHTTAEIGNSQTPTRTNVVRKRSKILTTVLKKNESCENNMDDSESNVNKNIEELNTSTEVSNLVRHNSKTKTSKSESSHKLFVDNENKLKEIIDTPDLSYKVEQKEMNRSPQNLTTECVVVIQKEIFNKSNANSTREVKNSLEVKNKKTKDPKQSQVLFDSDSDDIPLCRINKTSLTIPDTNSKIDISPTKNESKVTILEDKKTSTTDLKNVSKKSKLSRKNSKIEKVIKIESKPLSQSSFDDDDDDDDFDNRKTIVIKRTYDKISKPLKSKSTGSITDKDIEDIKTRIEVKKKLLLARSLHSETEDLRDLIKKWQKGCQEALVELMELMKKKMPDQPKMENTQILEMLKIPADLVGYDSENDCFNVPNDTNIILSSLKI